MKVGTAVLLGFLLRPQARTEGQGELTSSEGAVMTLAAIAALLYYANRKVPR